MGMIMVNDTLMICIVSSGYIYPENPSIWSGMFFMLFLKVKLLSTG